MQTFDVINIGTGAGGGTLMHSLKDSGKKILVLERGSFLPRQFLSLHRSCQSISYHYGKRNSDG